MDNPYVWIFLSFAVFIAVAYRFGKPAILAALDQKIATIRAEVDNAARLKAEAQALLNDFEQRQRDAARETERIIADARAQADHVRETEETRLAEMMARKEQQLNERIALLRDQAIAELRDQAATLAAQATDQLVRSRMDDATRTALVNRALDQVQKKL